MSRKKNTNEMEGKVPPQAVEAEEMVLGACLLEYGAIEKVVDLLKPETFYNQKNVHVFRALLELHDENAPIDMITLTERLKKNNKLEEVGGAYYITMLTSMVISASNIGVHAAIVREKYILRQLIRISSEIISRAYSNMEDPFDLLNEAQEQISKLTGFDKANIRHISSVFAELLEQIDRNILSNNEITGIPTGFSYFDRFSSGLQNGDLVIIAGETSNGKTALALNIAHHAAKNAGKKVVIYSYEMADRQLAARLLSAEALVSGKEILYAKLDDEKLTKVQNGIGVLAEQKIFIDELPSSRFEYLERSIRSMVLREDAELIIIDYLQLIKSGNKYAKQHEQFAETANKLKSIAKTLNIPIILLSQLARDKQNPFPSLARLKGSGDIENAADIVWFVWRPELYGRSDIECMGNSYPSDGNSHHIIAKGRNIGITEFVLGFNKKYTTFSNYVTERAAQKERADIF